MATHLLANEHPILLARQHWSTVAPTAVGGFVAVVLGAVVVGLVPSHVVGVTTDAIRHTALLALIVVVLAGVGWRLLQWRCQAYLLTDHRIVVTSGVIARVTESIALDRVQNTMVRQTLGARLIGCGDLEIESAGRDGVEVLRRIPDPQGFYTAIMEASEAHKHGLQPADGPPEEARPRQSHWG